MAKVKQMLDCKECLNINAGERWPIATTQLKHFHSAFSAVKKHELKYVSMTKFQAHQVIQHLPSETY